MLLQVLSILAAWLAYNAFCLVQNIRRARKAKLPIRAIPVSPLNPLWALLEPVVFSVLNRLPFTFGSFSRYARRGWHFVDKAYTYLEVGDAFLIVTPREIWFQTCDADTVNDIFARRSEFLRPYDLYEVLSVYGNNVITVNLKDWQRHRKAVATSFNERTNVYVWQESISQANDMLTAWINPGPRGVQGLAQDTRTLSLDVLAAVGFQKSYKFYSSSAKNASTQEAASERDYRSSLRVVLENAILMMVASPKILALPIMGIRLNRVAEATQDFKNYMLEMVDKEKQLLHDGQPGTGHLMTSLIRASDESDKASRSDTSNMLSVKEILGNIFVINFAGHDTTANTLAYAIILLAANPEVQNWIGEELDVVLDSMSPDDWVYDDLYPKLKRCFSVLLETVRLYPPISALPKRTTDQPTTLKVGKQLHVLPPKTYVTPALLACQVQPRYWGEDALKWKPQRWIEPNDHATNEPPASDLKHGRDQHLHEEKLVTPAQGTYFPWSEGPQYCPGKKFAQVEFVAVMAVLLRNHRVKVAPLAGESTAQARTRALNVCENSEYVLVLRMRDADSIRLIWEHKASSADG